MTKESLRKLNLPNTPGVYFFLGEKSKVLYIGKATSIRNRVRSYFTSDIHEKRSKLIEKMVTESVTIEYTKTDSVLEALILETNLIRTHKPLYNTRSKDDKSYNHIVITSEEFPRILVVRERDLQHRFKKSDIKWLFGPFPSGQLFKDALKIIQRLFQFYDTPRPIGKEKDKLSKGIINFNQQIGLYPSEKSPIEYKKSIRHIRLFLTGKKEQIIRELEKEMMKLASKQLFEDAAVIKKRIFALNHIQDVALIKGERLISPTSDGLRIEAYDISHLQGKNMVGVMVVVNESGVDKGEYRKFIIKSVDRSHDTAALKEVLNRRLAHTTWQLPNLIVVDGSLPQKNEAEYVLRKYKKEIPVVAVVKNAQHKPVKLLGRKRLIEKYKQLILLANSESHRFAINFHRKRKRQEVLK